MLSITQRLDAATHPMTRRLLQIMQRKQSNIALSADVLTADALLALVKACAPHICLLKTHIDIVQDFTPALTQTLRALADEHGFLIFEDRKFADIGHTVKWQYGEGIYRIADWAHITNAHTVPGPGIIEGLKQVGQEKGNALILLAEMSSAGNLATGDYTQRSLEMAEVHGDFVMGFIARRRLTNNPNLLHFTPGVKCLAGKDSLGQQYLTPSAAINAGSDVLIVGRGIYREDNPAQAAKLHQEEGWAAYLAAIQ